MTVKNLALTTPDDEEEDFAPDPVWGDDATEYASAPIVDTYKGEPHQDLKALTALEWLHGRDVMDAGFVCIPNVLELVYREARVPTINKKTGEVTEEKLNDIAIRVADKLLRHMYAKTDKSDPWIVWPSKRLVAMELDKGVQCVERGLRDLKRAGLIKRCPDGADGFTARWDLKPLLALEQEATPRYKEWHKRESEKVRERNKAKAETNNLAIQASRQKKERTRLHIARIA